jgi:hypothetical protein
VQISHRRLEVCVAEHILDRDGIEHAGEEGAGGVAQVVESERPERGTVAGSEVAPAECRRVESVAGGVAEHVVVPAREVGSLRQPVERGPPLRRCGVRSVFDALGDL